MVDIYTPNIPQPSDFPSNSQDQFRQNFNYLIPSGLSTTGLTRDHNMTLNSGTAGDGTHRQVTMSANLGATPGFSGAVSVVYPKTANGQSQLFFNNAAGDVQLTAQKASVPTASGTGCSYLPGGLLIQWGQDTKTIPNATSFLVNFGVGFTPRVTITPSAATSVTLFTQSVNASSFQVTTVSGSGTFTYDWIAIGPA